MKIYPFLLVFALIFLGLANAQEEGVGTVACEDCLCEFNASECVFCCDDSPNNQAAFFVANYEQYDINDCTKCRLAEEAAGIYPLEMCDGSVRYADGQGHWIESSCSPESLQYNLPLEGIVYFVDEEGLSTRICPEPPIRETIECGFYTKEVYCDTSEVFEGQDLFEPTWNTLVHINFPQASSCGASNLSICGNDILEEGEECDDGNLLPEDGCSSLCTTEEIEDGEQGLGGIATALILGIILAIILLIIFWRLMTRR